MGCGCSPWPSAWPLRACRRTRTSSSARRWSGASSLAASCGTASTSSSTITGGSAADATCTPKAANVSAHLRRNLAVMRKNCRYHPQTLARLLDNSACSVTAHLCGRFVLCELRGETRTVARTRTRHLAQLPGLRGRADGARCGLPIEIGMGVRMGGRTWVRGCGSYGGRP